MRSSIFKLTLFFLLLFGPVLMGWVYIKGYYNFFVTSSTFHLVTSYYKLVPIKSSVQGKEVVFTIKNEIPLRDINGKSHDFELDISIDMEAVTFNVPLTLSILLAIILIAKVPRQKKWEVFLTGVALLFLLHMASMLLFALCTIKAITTVNPYIHYYIHQHFVAGELLCAIKDFLVNYAARFEPFLIAFYAWITLHYISLRKL